MRPRPWIDPTPLENYVPAWAGQFDTFDDWVNHASRALTGVQDSNGQPLSSVCIDAKGRRCVNGRDFMTARDDGAFPVRYFWHMRPNATARLENWKKAGYSVDGDIYDDAKFRFSNGTRIRTSDLRAGQDLKEGVIIETMNSTYLLGKEAC